jgi:2-(1,2-epoxy-1,2-dihydrophenyl)acetyl-CoA isomerase
MLTRKPCKREDPMSFETLLFEVRDGIAHLTLNRPEAANAIDIPMSQELLQAALLCDEDPSVRAVLLSASGKLFCAGGDLASFRSAGEKLPSMLKQLTAGLHVAISRLARMRAPVVAAVGGTAAGAGFSLACAADLLLAGESAKFTMAYTRVGLVPDGSSTYFLPRLIGRRRTLELMLTNRVLGAAEALDWGLVNRLVPDDQLSAEAEKSARALAEGPTGAFGATKRLVLDSDDQSLESQMELEARAIADAARSADAREGIEAFFAKRAPQFRGA